MNQRATSDKVQIVQQKKLLLIVATNASIKFSIVFTKIHKAHQR
jgi:hypothetical protein